MGWSGVDHEARLYRNGARLHRRPDLGRDERLIREAMRIKAPIGRCELCSGKYPYADLLRQKHILVAPAGENRLPHSTPEDSNANWTCSAGAYLGRVSHASSKYWIRVNRDNTVTDMDGAPTWKGDGRLDTSGTNYVDASTWTTIWLWAYLGAYERVGGDVEFAVGLECNGTDHELGTVTLDRGLHTFIGSIAVSSIDAGDRSDVAPYFDVSTENATNGWWVQHVAILKDDANSQLRRGVYIRTRGSAIVRSTPVRKLVRLVTCPDCRRKGPLELVTIRDMELEETPRIQEDDSED